jgi:hypothetical protein
MRSTTAEVSERRPLRSHLSPLDDPAGTFRRGELAAGLATAALLGQLVFAPVTLLLAAALLAVGRASRWRPHWAAVPALASLSWLSAVGAAGAVAAFSDGSRRLARFLLSAAVHPGRLAHPAVAMAGASAWLPRQLPLALLAATGEASIVLWLGWWRRGWHWRPGLLAMLGGRITATALAAGHTVTRDGCALGLVAGTGKAAGFSWAEAVHGVLLAGPQGQELEQLGEAVTCAALRRRKTVLVLDMAAHPRLGPDRRPHRDDGAAARVAALARSLSVPAGVVSAPADGPAALGWAAQMSGVIGRAMRSRGVVLISAQRAAAARGVIDDLAGVLASLRDLGVRGDCLVWISGCDAIDPGSLREVRALGPLTGTAIMLSTTSRLQAATLAPASGVVVISAPVHDDLAWQLTDNVASPAAITASPAATTASPAAIGHELATDAPLWSSIANQGPNTFTILAGNRRDQRPPRVTSGCRAVTIEPDRLR